MLVAFRISFFVYLFAVCLGLYHTTLTVQIAKTQTNSIHIAER